MAPDHAPMFARTSEVAELRGDCPKRTVQVLDAIAIARGYPSRTSLVNEILGEWAEKVVHEATVVVRVTGINPTGAETLGGGR